MKFKHLLIFASFIFSLSAEQTQISLARTNFQAIQEAQAKIETMLKWHTVYQITTAACFIAGVGGAVYAIYHAATKKEALIPHNPLDPDKFRLFVEKFGAYMEMYNEKHNLQRNWIMSQLHWLKKTVYNQFQSIAVGVGAHMVFSGLNNALGPISKYITRLDGFVDRTVSGIFHKNSLNWFITDQANLVDLSNTLKRYAALVEGRQVTINATQVGQEPIVIEALSLDKRAEALQDFVAYWKIFIQQIETVVAFMHYKSLQTTNLVTGERMVAISTKIQGLVDDFALRCEEKAKQSENGIIVFYDELVAVTAQIGFEFSNFSLLDSYKRIDVMNETK